jgi:hypothetical protein
VHYKTKYANIVIISIVIIILVHNIISVYFYTMNACCTTVDVHITMDGRKFVTTTVVCYSTIVVGYYNVFVAFVMEI